MKRSKKAVFLLRCALGVLTVICGVCALLYCVFTFNFKGVGSLFHMTFRRQSSHSESTSVD